MNNSVAYNLSNLLFQPLEQAIVEANQGKKLKTLIIIQTKPSSISLLKCW